MFVSVLHWLYYLRKPCFNTKQQRLTRDIELIIKYIIINRTLYNVDQFYIPTLTIVKHLKYNISDWCRQHSCKVFENVFLNNCPFTYIYIYYCSVKQQIFSKAFKLAKVTPIYKKGEQSNKNTYIPILCSF